MRVPLEAQRKLYERHAAEAARQLSELLTTRRDELIELGARRAFDEVGVEQYGDGTYFKDPATLVDEAEAELADGIFYLQVRVARLHGDLPPD